MRDFSTYTMKSSLKSLALMRVLSALEAYIFQRTQRQKKKAVYGLPFLSIFILRYRS